MRTVVWMEKKASTETGHGQQGEDRPVPTPRVCGLCGSSLTWVQGWMVSGGDTLGHWHTQTQQFLGSFLLQGAPGEWWRGSPTADKTPSRQGPRCALANGGLWSVTHPSKPKALRWSQNIFGLSTKYRYYGSTFLSWNLKPKALSC